jgi:hypothetical protein
MANEHQGSCFCGAVRIRLTGEPEATGYCHCESCRAWSAGPINAFSLWKPDAVQIVAGADKLASYAKTPRSERTFCTACGGHVLIRHPHWNLIDIPQAVVPSFAWKPAVHVNYQESVLKVRDGLPKLRDLPKEMGGSGEPIGE